jgi:2-dehydropantoate 2-reductase
MGSLVAARLTLAGNDVLLFGRPSRHLTIAQQRGLTLTELDGSIHTVKVRASSDPAEAKGSDLVIVLVKAWATGEAVAPLRDHVTRETTVLTLQNGLGNASTLRTTLLKDGVRPSVWLGVTTQAALRTEPGTVAHTGEGISAIGRRHVGADDRLRRIATTFTEARLPTVAVDDIHRWVWRKLAVNAAINPRTALAGVPNAAIATDTGLRNAAAALAGETVTVANARGLTLDVQEVIASVDEVARETGQNRSSMLVDLETGGRTEINAINGAVVSEAAKHGIKVPANQMMTALVRARERRDKLFAAAAAMATAAADDETGM